MVNGPGFQKQNENCRRNGRGMCRNEPYRCFYWSEPAYQNFLVSHVCLRLGKLKTS